MNKFLRFGLMAIALTFFFNAFAVTETKAQAVLNEILKRMEARRAALQSLQSKVTMIKRDSLLDESDVYQGNVKLIPGKSENDMYVRIDWTKPASEMLAVIKTEYMLYKPPINQIYIGKVSKAKNSASAGNVLSFLSMSKAQLKANYTYKYLGEEKLSSGVKTVHLELTPKNKQKYKSAELWIDADGMPLQSKIIENNNDSTTILLYNEQLNPKLDGKDFVIDYDKAKTKVIKG